MAVVLALSVAAADRAGCGPAAVVVVVVVVGVAGGVGLAAGTTDAAAGFGRWCGRPLTFGVVGLDAGASGRGAGAG